MTQTTHTIEKIRSFLLDDGWTLLYSVGKLNIYTKGDDFEISLPKEADHPEYEDLVDSAVIDLAELYNTDEDDILIRIYGLPKNSQGDDAR